MKNKQCIITYVRRWNEYERMKENERLLKNSVRICRLCKGCGRLERTSFRMFRPESENAIGMTDCLSCDGDGYKCNWCLCSSEYCECGE